MTMCDNMFPYHENTREKQNRTKERKEEVTELEQ